MSHPLGKVSICFLAVTIPQTQSTTTVDHSNEPSILMDSEGYQLDDFYNRFFSFSPTRMSSSNRNLKHTIVLNR